MTDAAAAPALLTRKKRTRSGHRASATCLVNQAMTAMGAEDVDTDQLSLIRQMLVEKVETLKILDSEMAQLVPDDEVEEEIQCVDEYKEKVYGVLAKLNKALTPITAPTPTTVARTEPPPPAGHLPPAAETGHSATEPRTPTETPPPIVATTPTTDRVKLPKISLPHFRGNLMRWTAFWDSFNSAIHTNDRLSEIDKFNYLRSLLESTASDAIAGLALSAANYGEAVEISKHMESLLSITAVTSDNHLRDLRRLYDQAEANIQSLKALGIEPESYGAMLSSVLLTVSRKVSADDLDMDSLLETFEQELIARERANNSVSQSQRRVHNHGRSSTSAFVANVPGSPVYAFCQQSHSPTDCSSVPGLNTGKKILRDCGRCYNCLRKNHLSRNCRSTGKCKHCQGKHHTSICERGSHSRENPSLATPTELNPEAPAYTPSPATSTLCSTERKTILLQTARTVVHNPLKPGLAIEVGLLFDSGSQRSYLTERAMKLLQLKPTGRQTLSIATFGAIQEQTKVSPIVSVGICVKGYPNVSLSLHVVHTILPTYHCHCQSQ